MSGDDGRSASVQVPFAENVEWRGSQFGAGADRLQNHRDEVFRIGMLTPDFKCLLEFFFRKETSDRIFSAQAATAAFTIPSGALGGW